MSEELTEEHDGVESVTSQWTPEELDGKTVCFTEIGGREPILHLGVIHASLVGDPPGSLVVSVTTGDTLGGSDRCEHFVSQPIMDALVRGSGRLASDFHISLDTLPQR